MLLTKGTTVPTWLWIVIIVVVVLAVLGDPGRGRLLEVAVLVSKVCLASRSLKLAESTRRSVFWSPVLRWPDFSGLARERRSREQPASSERLR